MPATSSGRDRSDGASRSQFRAASSDLDRVHPGPQIRDGRDHSHPDRLGDLYFITGRLTEDKACDLLAFGSKAARPATRAMTKTKKSEKDKVPSHHSCHMP